MAHLNGSANVHYTSRRAGTAWKNPNQTNVLKILEIVNQRYMQSVYGRCQINDKMRKNSIKVEATSRKRPN